MPNPPALFLIVIGIFNIVYGLRIILRKHVTISVNVFSTNKIYFQGNAALNYGVGAFLSGWCVIVGLMIANLGYPKFFFLITGTMLILFGFVVALIGFMRALNMDSNDG